MMLINKCMIIWTGYPNEVEQYQTCMKVLKYLVAIFNSQQCEKFSIRSNHLLFIDGPGREGYCLDLCVVYRDVQQILAVHE